MCDDHDQFMCPHGERGNDILRLMNEHHRPLAEWMISKLPQIGPDRILDIGCGGGMLISILGKEFPESEIEGIDISEESIRISSETNKDLIYGGRCRLAVASVEDLPYGDRTFDLVTAVETYFFWPDLDHDISEAVRVLSDGGCLVIAAESYPDPEFDDVNSRYKEMYGVNLVGNDVLSSLLRSHGLSVETFTVKQNNWVAFVCRRIISDCS
jgi:ubiquinone/menaquinone biosynthesis C-methylase UbiE